MQQEPFGAPAPIHTSAYRHVYSGSLLLSIVVRRLQLPVVVQYSFLVVLGDVEVCRYPSSCSSYTDRLVDFCLHPKPFWRL